MSKRESILIVDDDESNQRSLSLIFKKKGYEIETAETGGEALEKAKKKSFNIALVDICLPDMEGIELIAPLKGIYPEMAVIIITAYATIENATRALNKGASGYIIKSLNMDEVLAIFRETFENQHLIEEKRQMEKLLRESEERLHNIVEKNADGIIVIDLDGFVHFINPAAESLLDRSANEYIGQQFGFPVITGESVEVDIIGRSKKIRTADMRSMETKWEGDIAFIISVRDITEHKKMEQMLIQSEKMASIGILAAGVAHEINNPMGYINSNLETLKKYSKKATNFFMGIQKLIDEYSKIKPSNEKAFIKGFLELKEDTDINFILKDMKDAIEESLEGSKKVKKIVSSLVDFSEERKTSMRPENINHCIKDTLNKIWNKLKDKAELVEEFGDIPLVECDIDKLNYVFMHILMNAVQSIDNHGIIKIKTYTIEDSIVIQISDTGKGIQKEDIGKIFDMFYTTKDPDEGTGLGLSISHRIIQEHNGTIDVESEPGKGSTFTINLPINRS